MRDRLRDFLLALHLKKKPRTATGAKAPTAAATAS
jgi:hypothetical protein